MLLSENQHIKSGWYTLCGITRQCFGSGNSVGLLPVTRVYVIGVCLANFQFCSCVRVPIFGLVCS